MIRTFNGHVPKVHPSAFVHDSAEVIGRVRLAADVSIWPLVALRGDIERIVIGAGSNIQDLTVAHTGWDRPTILGRAVTVGHNAILHGCRIGDGSLVGMGAIVMEATIGRNCLIAAGALVLAGLRASPFSLIMGSPAKVVRRLTAKELKSIRDGQKSYLHKARLHRRSSVPVFPR